VVVTGNLARYRYISTLGSGGMARVDLAEDTLLGREVALKRMSGAVDDRGLSRLRREALAGASLSHPNLVAIYDVVDSDEGELVVVMEYISGGTLRDLLNQKGRLPAEEALRILDGVAAGLDAIHARGIVHRDVKPSNILLGDGGTVKIADLGIAAIPDRTRITTTGSVVGSLSYMAPEQLENEPSTPAIDIYALAAVAYEVLSGEKARKETNPVTLAHAIATQDPPNLGNDWPEAPAGAAQLLVRAMSRDPAARPHSAGELVSRLRGELAPEPTTRVSRPAPGAARADAPLRRLGPPIAAASVAAAARQRAPAPRRAAPARPVGAGRPREPNHASLLSPPPERRRPPVGALVAGLLAVVAAVVVLAILLNSGSSPSRPAANAKAKASANPTAHRHHRAAPTHSTPASASSSSASTAAASTTAASTTAASTSTTPPPARTPAATPPPAGSPAAAVEAFYGAAAAHHYAAAWALADPTLRNQLQGYQSFQAGQAGDRSITFNSARVTNQSAQAATVAIQTTSVRNDGTQHCAGTVQLAPAGGRWLLHLLDINCS
jgi:eukaryotic-like serine/threonine-protein kinase